MGAFEESFHERLRFVTCDDFADPEKLQDVAERCVEAAGGEVDVLVNNLGAGNLGQTAESTTAASLLWHLNINVTSALLFTQACLSGLVKRQGCVVNLSSIAGTSSGARRARLCRRFHVRSQGAGRSRACFRTASQRGRSTS